MRGVSKALRHGMDHLPHHRARRFLRSVIDDALLDAPEEVCGNPLQVFESRKHLPLSRRIANVLDRRGWELRSSNAGSKRVDGIRMRMEIEDLIDMTLVAIGRRGVRGILENDEARDALSSHLYETFHHKRVVLVRRREMRG